MVSGLMVSFKRPIEEFETEDRLAIQAIINCNQKIRKTLANGETFNLGKSQAKQFQATIEQIKGVLDSELDEFSGLDFLNTLLVLVENIREASKKFTNRALAFYWDRMNEILFQFYLRDDPELNHIQDMDKGLMIANKITAVMEA